MPPRNGQSPAQLERNRKGGLATAARLGHEGAVLRGQKGGRPKVLRLPENWENGLCPRCMRPLPKREQQHQ